MSKSWNRVMNMSVAQKLVTFIYLTTVVLFGFLSAYLIFNSEKYSRLQIDSANLNSVKYANILVEKEERYLQGLADYMCIIPDVQDMLMESNLGMPAQMSPDVIQMAQIRLNIVDLAFYNMEGKIVDYISIDQSYAPVDQISGDTERPIQRLYGSLHTYEWEYIPQNATVYMFHDNSPKLCLWQVVLSSKTNRPIGYVMIAIDTRKLLGANNPPRSSLADSIVMLDADGQQMYNRTGIGISDADASLMLANAAPDAGQFTLVINGQRYRIAYAKQSGTPFTSFSLIPYHYFTWNNLDAIIYILVGILFCLLLLLPIYVFITNILTRPIHTLIRSMEQFSQGDFDASVSFKYTDEIGQLGNVFNKMVRDNKALIDHAYVLKLREREAELSFLQAQINPHFLYNMIHTIQWKALRKGDEEIANLAYSLGQVFRISLNHGNNIISLRQEMNLVSYYLSLQKERFGERIEYSLEFDDEVLETMIPKLIIQPLVENSVVHGCEKSTDTVHVSVKAFPLTDRGRLRIEVLDDGIGIPPDVLALLPDKLTADEAPSQGSHYALHNIYERLTLSYGDDFSFEIESTQGEGTSVHIDLPLDKPLEEFTYSSSDDRPDHS